MELTTKILIGLGGAATVATAAGVAEHYQNKAIAAKLINRPLVPILFPLSQSYGQLSIIPGPFTMGALTLSMSAMTAASVNVPGNSSYITPAAMTLGTITPNRVGFLLPYDTMDSSGNLGFSDPGLEVVGLPQVTGSTDITVIPLTNVNALAGQDPSTVQWALKATRTGTTTLTVVWQTAGKGLKSATIPITVVP